MMAEGSEEIIGRFLGCLVGIMQGEARLGWIRTFDSPFSTFTTSIRLDR